MLKALSLDPLSMLIHTAVGDAYYYAREYEKLGRLLPEWRSSSIRASTARTPTSRARSRRSAASTRRARNTRKAAGWRAAWPGRRSGLAHLEASSGNEAEARRILEELIAARSHRVVSAWGIAALHASLGDVDEAFRWLDVAVEERATGLIFLRVHPRLDPIRQDPRYEALLRKVGLDAV